MFNLLLKLLLISIVIVPALLGVKAANARVGPRGLRALKTGWLLYGVLWVCLLYYLKHRWVG
jgi:hypothetical protein